MQKDLVAISTVTVDQLPYMYQVIHLLMQKILRRAREEGKILVSRTVAKYREQLYLPVARLRKVLI